MTVYVGAIGLTYASMHGLWNHHYARQSEGSETCIDLHWEF